MKSTLIRMVMGAAALSVATGVAAGQYSAVNLATNTPGGGGAFTDANLMNTWGLAFTPDGSAWAANSGSGTSTSYNGTGLSQPQPSPLVVGVNTAGGLSGGTPTGMVYSGGPGYDITSNGTTAPSQFLYSTSDGQILGYNSDVGAIGAAPSESTVVGVDRSAMNANYTGLGLDDNGTGRLFAADFNNGRVDMFDTGFNPFVKSGAFTDPTLPAGFRPFGVQMVNGGVYVTYAQQDPVTLQAATGSGMGLVSVYDTNGQFIRRLASGGTLNAPWGVTMAPATFGQFANAILVGNSGDGTINAFNPVTGKYLGSMTDDQGTPIMIPNLHGLSFGNDAETQSDNALFFTAGDSSTGVLGRIDTIAVPTPASSLLGGFMMLAFGRRRR